jgi:hypothetical protein
MTVRAEFIDKPGSAACGVAEITISYAGCICLKSVSRNRLPVVNIQ